MLPCDTVIHDIYILNVHFTIKVSMPKKSLKNKILSEVVIFEIYPVTSPSSAITQVDQQLKEG